MKNATHVARRVSYFLRAYACGSPRHRSLSVNHRKGKGMWETEGRVWGRVLRAN